MLWAYPCPHVHGKELKIKRNAKAAMVDFQVTSQKTDGTKRTLKQCAAFYLIPLLMLELAIANVDRAFRCVPQTMKRFSVGKKRNMPLKKN
jgi:hypothetical protein